jgi:predicted GNAT family acetyltransferase
MSGADSLYSVLSRRNLFDGSLDDFQSKIADPKYRSAVYQILNRRDLVSGSLEEFEQGLVPQQQEELVIPDVTTEKIDIIQPDAPIEQLGPPAPLPEQILPPTEELNAIGVEVPQAEAPQEQAPVEPLPEPTEVPPVALPLDVGGDDKEKGLFEVAFNKILIQPYNSFMAGIDKTNASGFDMLDTYAKRMSELNGGTGYNEFLKDLTDVYVKNYEAYEARGIPKDQGFANDAAKAIYEGMGSLAAILPLLLNLGPLALPLYGAAQGGAESIKQGESALKGAAIGAAKGTLLKGALGTAAKLPKPIGAPLVGATFATESIAEGDWDQAAADMILGIGLSLTGGKSQSMKEATKEVSRTLGLDKKITSLKLTKTEIEALKKVFSQPEGATGDKVAKQSDVEFVQSLTKGGKKSPLFREIFGATGSKKIPVTVENKVRAIYNRLMGKPVTEGLKVSESKAPAEEPQKLIGAGEYLKVYRGIKYKNVKDGKVFGGNREIYNENYKKDGGWLPSGTVFVSKNKAYADTYVGYGKDAELLEFKIPKAYYDKHAITLEAKTPMSNVGDADITVFTGGIPEKFLVKPTVQEPAPKKPIVEPEKKATPKKAVKSGKGVITTIPVADSGSSKPKKGLTLTDSRGGWLEAEDIGNGEIQVYNINVDPTQRKKGIALGLYKKFIEEAKKAGYKKIVSDSSVSEGAIGIWEKLGAVKSTVETKETNSAEGVFTGKSIFTVDNSPLYSLELTQTKPVEKKAEIKETPPEIVERIKGKVDKAEGAKIITEIEKSLTSFPEHTTGIVRDPITPQGKKMVKGIQKHKFRGKVGLRSIIEMVNKAVRTEIRTGASQTSKKYPAHYEPKYHMIRAKSDRTQLILHEQGHGLYQTIIDANPNALSEIKKDLEAIGEMDLSMASAHNEHEGFAEWFRRYVVNYGSIKDLKATPVIEEYLEVFHPPVWDVLQDAQLAYQELMAKSPVARREIMDNDIANPSLVDAVKEVNATLAHAVARGYAMERVDRRVYKAIVTGAKEMGMVHKDAQAMADKWRKDIAKGGSDILGIFQSTVLAPTEINNILEGYPTGQNGVRVLGDDGNYIQVGDESWREIKERVGFDNWKAFDLYARSKAALSRYKVKGLDYQGVKDVLPPAELEKLVSDFEKSFPEYTKHFKDANNFADDLAEVMVLSGEKTREEVDKMKDTYDAYVPLLSSEGGGKVGAVAGEPSSKINFATGNLGGTINLDDAIAKRTKDVIEAYYSNQSMMSLVKMVEKTQADKSLPFFARAEAGRVITKLKLDTKKMANLSEDEAKSIIAKFLEVPPSAVDLTWGGKAIWRGAKPNITNVIAPFVNGKREYYQIDDPLLYNLFAGSRSPSDLVKFYDDLFTPITAPWKRVLTRTLLFTSRNLPRDAANAIVMGDGGESAIQFSYAWAGLMNKITGKMPTAKRTSELFSKGIEGTGSVGHKTRKNAFTKTLMEGLEPIENWKVMSWPQRATAMPGLTMNIFTKPIDLFLAGTGQTALAEAGETATREGAAIQEIKAGGTDRSVNNAYAFISGNFGEKSGYADVSGLVKPTGFVNPGLQIMHRQLLKATNPSDKQRREFWAKLLIAVPTNTLALWALKELLSDDDDKKREKERPTADRGAYVDFKGVRMPFDYGMIGAVQSLSWNWADTQVANIPLYDRQAYAMSVLKRVGDLPVNTMDYYAPILRLREELKANRNFYFQKYIVPPMMESLDPEDQKFASTPKLYNDIGKVLKYSPIKLQYAFNNAGFQQYDEVIKVADRINRGIPLKEKADYPFVGRLFIRNPKGWGSASVQEVQKRLDERVSKLKREAKEKVGITFYKGDINLYLKDVRSNTTEGSFEREALDRQILTYMLYDNTQKEINRQNRAITKIRRKEQLSPDEYIMIEQLKEEMTRVAQQALLLDDNDIWENTPKRDRKIKRWLNQ